MQKLSIRILNIQTYPARYIVTFAAQEMSGKFCYFIRTNWENRTIFQLLWAASFIFLFLYNFVRIVF